MKIWSISEGAQKHWEWLRPYVERSLLRNVDGYTASDALQAVLSGNSFFLICEDGDGIKMVSVIDIQPDALHVHTMSGDGMKKWVSAVNDALTSIAKVLGKSSITTTARKGWQPTLGGLGWKKHSVYMVRSIS